MDISDWSVLKVRQELEEKGYEAAIYNTFHGKYISLYIVI